MTVLFATPQPKDAAALRELFAVIRDETASSDQFQEFEGTLLQDMQAVDYFARFIQLHVLLEEKLSVAQPHRDRSSSSSVRDDTIEPVASSTAPFSFLSTAFHGTIGFFSQELPFSLLIATVLTSLGLWVASMVYVSSPEKIAHDSFSLPAKSSVDPTLEVVGKITGMVDCKWADPHTETFNGANVLLGRKYALDSGLMEITYNTEAKVILQGPVTYEVEANGGYLTVGKLTGKLEKTVAGGQWPVASEWGPKSRNPEISKSSISNPQSPIPNPFCIRTPNAVVTDLGTEFGVEVHKSGVTKAHVFRGAVAVRSVSTLGVNKEESQEVVVRQDESVRVEKPTATHGDPHVTVIHDPLESLHFVQSLPPPKKRLPMTVLAHFRMGEDDPGAVAGQPAGEKTINLGHAYHLKRYGSPAYTTDTVAPGSSLAMNITGAEGEYFYSRYLCATPTDNFILEAWVRPNRVPAEHAYIVYTGLGSRDGYGLLLVAKRGYCVLLGGVAFGPLEAPCELGKWAHLALVCEQGNLQLWVNSRLVGKTHDIALIPSSGHFSIGGTPENPSPFSRFFDGQIDEVRLSEFRGPFNVAMLLFPSAATRPAVPSEKRQVRTTREKVGEPHARSLDEK